MDMHFKFCSWYYFSALIKSNLQSQIYIYGDIHIIEITNHYKIFETFFYAFNNDFVLNILIDINMLNNLEYFANLSCAYLKLKFEL